MNKTDCCPTNIKECVQNIDSSSTLNANELSQRGVQCRPADLTLRPLCTLMKSLVLDRGIIKGPKGIINAVLSSCQAFTTYLKLWELNKVRKRTRK